MNKINADLNQIADRLYFSMLSNYSSDQVMVGIDNGPPAKLILCLFIKPKDIKITLTSFENIPVITHHLNKIISTLYE